MAMAPNPLSCHIKLPLPKHSTPSNIVNLLLISASLVPGGGGGGGGGGGYVYRMSLISVIVTSGCGVTLHTHFQFLSTYMVDKAELCLLDSGKSGVGKSTIHKKPV